MDFLARRFCKLPSELRKLTLEDYEFNLFIARAGLDAEKRQREKANKRG